MFGIVVQAGLVIANALLETLPIVDPKDAAANRMVRKTWGKVGIEVDQWKGLQVGQQSDTLFTVEARDVADAFGVIAPDNSLIKIRSDHAWDDVQGVTIKQPDPLPATVMSIIGEYKSGR